MSDNSFYLDQVKAWQEEPMTVRLVNLLEALRYETQQKYIEALTQDQFNYLRGLEIGYERALEVIRTEIKEPISLRMVQIPTIEKG